MFQKSLNLTVIACFFLTTLTPYPQAHADPVLSLPAPGNMINLSPAYEPVIIKGLTVHKDNPFLFDFIVDVGQDKMSGEPLKKEGEKLIKYFLASLTIPDKDLWVNLSPYEKNRMIPEALGQTDMGRDLLEQDYILKQITASLIYPEKNLGKKFWDKVYAKAQEMYGTTQVPVNTFNKVWIMADRAEVFEHNQTAFVVGSHLKVMLEEDYLALQKHSGSVIARSPQGDEAISKRTTNDSYALASQIVKQIILPELEKEVNTGRNFANLRQIFNSIILSSWYKRNLKEALLNQVYADKSKVKGVMASGAKQSREQIYEQYLKAYKKGVFNYIKEEPADVSLRGGGADEAISKGTTIPRKYFSGGMEIAPSHVDVITDAAMGADKMRQENWNGEIDFQTGLDTKAGTAGRPDTAMLSFRNDEKVGDVHAAFSEVLNPKALDLLAEFAPRTEEIHALLQKEAAAYKAQADRGEEPGFLPVENADGSDYVVPGMKVSVKQAYAGDFEGAPVPEIFQKPGATITGPTARYGQPVEKSIRSIAYQLLSGAEYVLLDGEDSFSQLGTMSLEGQRNLKLAISKDPVFMKAVEEVANEMIQKGKRPANWNWRKLIDENYTTRVYRVRGLHLDDRQVKYTTADGRQIAISATLADAILYVVNNYEALLDQGAPIALYFPKIQSAQEAALFTQILDDLEATLEYKGKKLKDIVLEDGKPGGIIKVLVLIENVRAALQLMPIRAAFGRHIVLINTARWDYLATVIKAKDYDPLWVPDDFSRIGMTYPFMHTFENAVWRAANTPDKNDNTILWEGGMEVQIPTIPDDIPQAEKDQYIKGFMAKASANKLREAKAGAPRAWVAHPDMVGIVASVFKDLYGDGKAPVIGQKVNLDGEKWTSLTYTPEDAQAFFKLADKQVMTVEGLRQDISVYMQYKLNVLTGQGAASIKPADSFFDPSVPYLMEDRATDEGRGAGARKKFNARVQFTEDDTSVGVKAGDRLTPELFNRLVSEEFNKLLRAPDRIVHDNVKSTILPIARLALEKFVTSRVNIPWSVDLEGVVLGVTDPAKAGQLMDEYINQLRDSGGISRMTENPQFVDAAMNAAQPGDLRILPRTLEQRVADVNMENNYLREEGRFLETWYSPEDVATQRPAVARQFTVPNYNADNFNTGLRRHFVDLTAINTLGPTNNVQAEGLIRGLKHIYQAQIKEQDLLQVTSAENAGKLFEELKADGYLDKDGLIADKFALLELKGRNSAIQLSSQFSSISNEVYMLLLNKMWAKIEAFYLGGWDAMMKLGYADQARGGPEYLGKLAAEISQLFTRHLVGQQVAMRHMSAEQSAKLKEVNFYVPLFIDFDEAHLKPQEMVRIVFTMGEEETMIAAIHVEDQGHGAKQCGHNANKVLTSTQQWLATINAIRFRLQVMGLRVLIVARTDAEQADWIQSDLDGRDQEFIMGATNPVADFEANKQEDLDRAKRNLEESIHHQEQLIAMGIKVGQDERITPATINKSLDALSQDWDDNYRSKWDEMYKLMVVDGKMRRYNDVIIEGQVNGLDGEGLQELHNFWKKIARVRTIDQAVEETIRNSQAPLQMTPEEWRNWVNGLQRSRNFDFFGAVAKKASELGIEIYDSKGWERETRKNPDFDKNGTHILWDHDVASFLDTTGHLWMIDSGIKMAVARNKYSLAQADIQWFEQHKPDWFEVAYWAIELDKEAIQLLIRKKFWGILDGYAQEIKPKVVGVLSKYLLGTRYTDKNGFLKAMRELMGLGIKEKESKMLLQSVIRLKANNTSPSFFWRGAKKANGELFTDEDLRTFLIKQAPFSQFNFSTYYGSVQAHANAIEFANAFLKDGTLVYADRQVAGAQAGSGMSVNPQKFAGTEMGADADAAAKGGKSLGANSAKSTMNARKKAIEKIVNTQRAHELTLILFAKTSFKQALSQADGRNLLPAEQSAAFNYITDLIVRTSGLPLADPISDTLYQKKDVFKNVIITEDDINQMSGIGQNILANIVLRLLNDMAMSTPGGIDLNTSNGMQWKITKDGNGVEMTVDPAMIERIRHIGINWLSPVIFKMTPIASVWPLVGLHSFSK